MTGPFGMGVLKPAFLGEPPISMAFVGTPFTSLGIPYYGDFDPASNLLITGDVSNGTMVIVDCTTNNPALVSSTFSSVGWWDAKWGPTVATAYHMTRHFSTTTVHGIQGYNTTNPAAPSAVAFAQFTDVVNFYRHGLRLLVSTLAGDLKRFTISSGTPTATGTTLVGAGGFGCGHPLNADVAFIGKGASILSLDISGSTPTILQTFTPGGGFDGTRMSALGNRLYVLGNGKFSMIDITNPASLSLLGTLSDSAFDGGGPVALEPNGKYAYVTNAFAGTGKRIDAIDCRVPGSMSILATLSGLGVITNPSDMFYDHPDRLILITQSPSIRVVSITR